MKAEKVLGNDANEAPAQVAKTPRAQRAAVESRTRGRILIVDDEVFIRNAFRLYFDTIGFEVRVADGGEAALAVFDKGDFDVDVVILDLVMPGLKGLEVLTRVKQTHPEIEVIIATGCGSLSSAIEAMRSGAFDYITKPIVNFEEELLKVVEDAILQRRDRLKARRLADLSTTTHTAQRGFHYLTLFDKFIALASQTALWRVDHLPAESQRADHSRRVLTHLQDVLRTELGIDSGMFFPRRKEGGFDFSRSHSWGRAKSVQFNADWFSNRKVFRCVLDAEVFTFPTEDLSVEQIGFDSQDLDELPMAIHLPLVLEGAHRGALLLFFTKQADVLRQSDFAERGHPFVLLSPLLASILCAATRHTA